MSHTESDSQAFQIQADFMADLHTLSDKYYVRYPWLREQESGLRTIARSAEQPFSVAVCGYMKAGKSSLINALIAQPLTITGTTEATATINMIAYDPHRKDTFIAHWNDREPEELPLPRLQLWAGGQEIEERVRSTHHLTLHTDSEDLDRAHARIIDTPGFGSVVQAHQEVVDSFFDPREPLAHAMVLVLGPSYKGSSQNAIQEFRKSSPPGTGPYNTVGVLHKWDHIYVESRGDWSMVQSHVDQWKTYLHEDLCDVIPVSAPVALVARIGQDDWLEALLALLSGMDDATFDAAIKSDRRWCSDPQREHVWQMVPTQLGMERDKVFPWASFAMSALHLYLRKPADAAEARRLLTDLGGLERLKNFLDERFYRRAAYIRRNQMSRQAQLVIDSATRAMEERKRNLTADLIRWNALVSHARTEADLAAWVERRLAEAQEEQQDLQQMAVSIDRFTRTVQKTWDQDLVSTLDTDTLAAWFGLTGQEAELLGRVVRVREQDGRPIVSPGEFDLPLLLACYNTIARSRNDNPNKEQEKAAEFLSRKLIGIVQSLNPA